MKSFKDNAGRDWTIGVNVDTIKRVRGLCTVDLLSAATSDLISRLRGDPVLLVDVLFAACQPQAKAAGVSDEDFGRAMAGDAIDLATEALLQELTDFFPNAKRQMIRTALAKHDEIQAEAVVQVTAKIKGMDAKQLLREALGDSATNSPANSASTQDRSRSAS